MKENSQILKLEYKHYYANCIKQSVLLWLHNELQKAKLSIEYVKYLIIRRLDY
jgi:hypothetical protein